MTRDMRGVLPTLGLVIFAAAFVALCMGVK